MKILGIIPARKGSKGLPNKNKLILGGKPLICHTFEQALACNNLESLILTSNDEDIIDLAHQYKIEVPFTRPSHLSLDDSSTIDVIKHSLEILENNERSFDAVCLLQPTSPFRPTGVIDAAIEKFIHGKYDSLVSLRKIPDHYNPYWAFEYDDGFVSKVLDNNYFRRQDLPMTFHRDGAIYIAQVNIIRDYGKLIGDRCGSIEINSPELINIDSFEDLLVAEKYFN